MMRYQHDHTTQTFSRRTVRLSATSMQMTTAGGSDKRERCQNAPAMTLHKFWADCLAYCGLCCVTNAMAAKYALCRYAATTDSCHAAQARYCIPPQRHSVTRTWIHVPSSRESRQGHPQLLEQLAYGLANPGTTDQARKPDGR